MFTEQEISFLLKPHQVEHAAGNRTLTEAIDLRQLGCPQRVFDRILESRAKRLGRKFTECRNSCVLTVSSPSVPSLEAQINAVKLF